MSWRRNGDDQSGVALEERESESAPEDAEALAPESRRLLLWRKLALATVFAALVGGLAWTFIGGDDNKRQGAPLVRPPTTDAAPAPPAATGPPELRNTGEDFNDIVRSVNDYVNWAFEHDPDPKWAPFIDHPECECFTTTTDAMASLRAEGHHHDSPGVKVHKVILRNRPRPELVTLYVIIEGLPGAIVDSNGNVVKERPPLAPTGFLEHWLRGEDGRWRTYKTTLLGPPDEGWERL